jgi:hypothetical protein
LSTNYRHVVFIVLLLAPIQCELGMLGTEGLPRTPSRLAGLMTQSGLNGASGCAGRHRYMTKDALQ